MQQSEHRRKNPNLHLLQHKNFGFERTKQMKNYLRTKRYVEKRLPEKSSESISCLELMMPARHLLWKSMLLKTEAKDQVK